VMALIGSEKEAITPGCDGDAATCNGDEYLAGGYISPSVSDPPLAGSDSDSLADCGKGGKGGKAVSMRFSSGGVLRKCAEMSAPSSAGWGSKVAVLSADGVISALIRKGGC
jgi:hypothetical protein